MGYLEYRWILIFYHAGAEDYRAIGGQWFDNLEECKRFAEDLEFDYCCGYSFEYESRLKVVYDVAPAA